MGTDNGIRNTEWERALEAKIDASGWGLFFIWVGVALVASVGWGIALLGTGLIALGAQLARHFSELPVEGWSVGFGVCMSVAGIVQWLDIPVGQTPMPGWLVPAVFAALGLAILLSTWGRKR